MALRNQVFSQMAKGLSVHFLVKGLQFEKSGTMTTPWGAGTWGALKREGAPADEDLLFADFIGQQHAVSLHAEGWPKLLSTRCADFENVTVMVL